MWGIFCENTFCFLNISSVAIGELLKPSTLQFHAWKWWNNQHVSLKSQLEIHTLIFVQNDWEGCNSFANFSIVNFFEEHKIIKWMCYLKRYMTSIYLGFGSFPHHPLPSILPIISTNLFAKSQWFTIHIHVINNHITNVSH